MAIKRLNDLAIAKSRRELRFAGSKRHRHKNETHRYELQLLEFHKSIILPS